MKHYQQKTSKCFVACRKSDVNDYKMMTQPNKLFCVPQFHTPDLVTTLSTVFLSFFLSFCESSIKILSMPIQFDSGIHNYETLAASAKRKVQASQVPVKKQMRVFTNP